MLLELAVRDLGVIDEMRLVLGPGMTAVTGETGAGKTLVVEAIELLVGGRADATLVRPGAAEARVDGRFVVGDDEEVVLARVVPAEGRSRAYVDGRPAPVSTLAEHGAGLVDLHGQHAHQSLLRAEAQRRALDRFGGVDEGPLQAARQRLAEIDAAMEALGGDARARAREVDLLRFQVDEIDRAGITRPDEDEELARTEALLADATAHREAVAAALAALADEGGAADDLGLALAALAGREPFGAIESRLRDLAAELADVASELRGAGEGIEEDPARLAEVQERRALLRDLRRKYGETLDEVLAFRAESAGRLAELERHDARVAELEAERTQAAEAEQAAATAVAAARRAAAPELAAAVRERLVDLGMRDADIEVVVEGEGPADEVRFLFSANSGEPVRPLARVASGGELARAMLALRLVLTEGPPTMVFDEVDAGIGGEAAVAVGRALADLGRERQVLVVTHLAQVAAAADAQVGVHKLERQGRTRAAAAPVDGEARVVELSRMLSGSPTSATAREHAEELLAANQRGSGR